MNLQVGLQTDEAEVLLEFTQKVQGLPPPVVVVRENLWRA